MGYEIVKTFQPHIATSQIEIPKGAILKKGEQPERYLQLKLQNASKEILKELTIDIECFNREGLSLGMQTYTYDDLFVPAGEVWGTDVAILLENPMTESVKLSINENCICYVNVVPNTSTVQSLSTKHPISKTGIAVIDKNKYGFICLASILLSLFVFLFFFVLNLLEISINLGSRDPLTYVWMYFALVRGISGLYPLYVLSLLKNDLDRQALILTIFFWGCLSVSVLGAILDIPQRMFYMESTTAGFAGFVTLYKFMFYYLIIIFSIIEIILFGSGKKYVLTTIPILFLLFGIVTIYVPIPAGVDYFISLLCILSGPYYLLKCKNIK